MFGLRSSMPERTSVGQWKWSVTPEYHPTFSQIFLDERPLADDSRNLVLTVAHKAQRVLCVHLPSCRVTHIRAHKGSAVMGELPMLLPSAFLAAALGFVNSLFRGCNSRRRVARRNLGGLTIDFSVVAPEQDRA
jgi:hypothetical protein